MPPFKHNYGFEDHAWLSVNQNCHSELNFLFASANIENDMMNLVSLIP